MTDLEAIASLLELVNGTGAFAVTVKLDYLDDKPPAASLQQLNGTRVREPYVDGSGIGELPFALLYRVKRTDSATRVNAPAALMLAAEKLETVALPAGFVDLRGVDTPVLVERNDNNNSEVWRASFVLERDVPPRVRARIDA